MNFSSSLLDSKFALRNRVLLAAVMFASQSAPALADEPGSQLEEVLVTGQALSVKRAIDAKRSAENIVDASVQDDMGRLPDLNTAAVIRRITGVAVQNDQAEARFPIIRGLNSTYNRTTIDGGIVASPERGGNGRAVPLDLIPASLVSRLEVIKSVTPELDANAIGGTIDVITRSAFDHEEAFFYGAAFMGYAEQSGDGETLAGDDYEQPWRANVATGTTFGGEDQFGVVVGLDYSLRNFEIPQIEVDDADYTEFDNNGNNVGLGNGNGQVVPTNSRLFFYNNERERIGGTLKLQWRPTDRVEASLSGLYVQFNDGERRDEYLYEMGESGSSGQPATITDQTATSGTSATGYGVVGIGRFTLDREISHLQGDIKWQASDDLWLEARITHSGAKLDNPESTEAYSTDTSFGATYDTSGFFNDYHPLDVAGFNDPGNYVFQNRGVLDRFADDDINEFVLDATYHLESVTLKSGLAYRTQDKTEGFTFNRYIASPELAYTLADVVSTGLADVGFQSGQTFGMNVNSELANTYFANNRDQFSVSSTTVSGSKAGEDVLAGYFQAAYDYGRGTVTGGLRVEQTDFDGGPDNGETISGDYTNWLPSIVLRHELNQDLVLRSAASLTLGRPDINLLTRGETLNLAESSVSRSNPDLEPRVSTNLDVSLEWYIQGGILAAGVFYKDIQDEIFTLTTNQTLVIDGNTFDTVTQPENAADAQILGLELQYSQTLSFLPAPWNGLGFGANLTLLDTDFEVPLQDGDTRSTSLYQQPDSLYNLTAFYAGDRFEVRASYNYTDEFLDTLNANDPNLDEYWDERGQLDAQIRFNLSDKIILVAEAINITDEGRRELTGPGHNYLQEDAMFGRTYWVGLNVSF